MRDLSISELIRAGFRRTPHPDNKDWYKVEGERVMIFSKGNGDLYERKYDGQPTEALKERLGLRE